MGKRPVKRPKHVQPTPENDETWPIGLLPGGKELFEVDEELNPVNPENE
jgi:hypothetical protein